MTRTVPLELPTIDSEDRQSDHHIDMARWELLAAQALVDEGVVCPAEMGLSFIGAAEMAALNEQHMDSTGPTDVLAFPLDGNTAPVDGSPALVGDIVICPSRAMLAVTPSHPFEDELALLVVHGVLHLCGHDHAEPHEREVMQRRERELLAAFHAEPPASIRSSQV